MRTSFLTVLHQHVQGFNAKAGHVAGLPGMTAFNGFHTALAMKLGKILRTSFVPRGVTIAVSSLHLREGQPGYIWTATNRGSAKPDKEVPFPEGFSDEQKAQARAQTAFSKNPSTAHEIQGDAVVHLVMEFANDEDVAISEQAVTDALSTMRLAGGELPMQVPRQRPRSVEVSLSYDDALAKIPARSWILEDATSTFERFLDRYPQQSMFDAFLRFTSNRRLKKTTEATVTEGPVSDDSDSSAETIGSPSAGTTDGTVDVEASLEDLVAVDVTDEPAADPFDDPEMLVLPHRLPVLSGWRLLTDPEILETVQRVPGAPTAMAEAVHGVVFARLAGVIRFERAQALENNTAAPPTHFRWTWRHLGAAKAGLMVGEGAV